MNKKTYVDGPVPITGGLKATVMAMLEAVPSEAVDRVLIIYAEGLEQLTGVFFLNLPVRFDPAYKDLVGYIGLEYQKA